MDKVQIALSTLLIGLVLIIIVYYIQNFEVKSGKKNTFLIIGHNNSGKTLLFNRLTGSSNSSTISSMEANYGTIGLPISNEAIQKPFQLIDYPGYLKYDNIFKSVIAEVNLEGVLFVLDADMTSIKNNTNLICLKLFKVFTITECVPNGVDFLVCVNKTDLFNALPINKIKQLLEAEMTKVIESELKNNEDDLNFWHDYLPFAFEKLNGNVEFKNGSALKNKISDWENWLDERVVNP